MEEKIEKDKPSFFSTIDNRYWIMFGLGLIFLALVFLEIYNGTLKPELRQITDVVWTYYPTHKIIALYILAFIFIAIASPMLVIALIRIITPLRAKYQWTWKTKNKFARIVIYLPSILLSALIIFAIISLLLTLQISSYYGYTHLTFALIQSATAIALFLFITMTISVLPWMNTKVFLSLESKFYKAPK